MRPSYDPDKTSLHAFPRFDHINNAVVTSHFQSNFATRIPHNQLTLPSCLFFKIHVLRTRPRTALLICTGITHILNLASLVLWILTTHLWWVLTSFVAVYFSLRTEENCRYSIWRAEIGRVAGAEFVSVRFYLSWILTFGLQSGVQERAEEHSYWRCDLSQRLPRPIKATSLSILIVVNSNDPVFHLWLILVRSGLGSRHSGQAWMAQGGKKINLCRTRSSPPGWAFVIIFRNILCYVLQPESVLALVSVKTGADVFGTDSLYIFCSVISVYSCTANALFYTQPHFAFLSSIRLNVRD